jgi:hypothetical protein
MHGGRREKKIDNLCELCVSVVNIDYANTKVAGFDIRISDFRSLLGAINFVEVVLLNI